MLCKVNNCQSEASSKQLCKKHYSRLRRTGTTDDGPKAFGAPEERFWKKVRKTKDCWVWTGPVRTTGYGQLSMGGRRGKLVGAHRFSWEMHNGPIPAGAGPHGTVVRHKCDNRLCVNPAHLEIGTQGDNVKDMDKRGGRVNAQPNGQRHGNSKFTDKQVLSIRESGLSNAEVARQYGVTRQCIRYLRNNGWQHLNEQ